MTSGAPQSEVERLRKENELLRKALLGVIRVADRATDEFDAARAALALGNKRLEAAVNAKLPP